MNILAIDTSCDDTCISILKVKNQKSKTVEFNILSNVVSSQIKVHQKYGGVYPTLAKREHQKNLVPVLRQALKKAKLLKTSKNQKPNIDLIAVTIGPGLDPCLWVGVNFAKALSYFWQVPIIPVNHIEGHILVNFLTKSGNNFQKSFPAICLVVSGGHTQLILMKGIGNYKIIGETRDDAAGECFDKTARILGLDYPGGPAIASEALKLSVIKNQSLINLSRPMINSKNYDFSFSGLKTAVLYDFKKRPKKTKRSKKYISEMAKEIQQAIIDVLIKKTIKAAKDYKVKSIILGGGVTANKELRKQFKERIKKEIPSIKYYLSNTEYCTDNAAMIGIAGYFNQKKSTKNWRKIQVNANLRI